MGWGLASHRRVVVVPEVLPDFTGMIVKVFIRGPDETWSWWFFDEPRLELQGGRMFLIGRMSDRSTPTKPFWGVNSTAAVPWESVVFYICERILDRQQRKYGGPDCPTIPY